MGRKIPGKKHRTVKDPYKQHALRCSLLKNKINKAPLDPDEQPIPKSVIRLMKLKEKCAGKSIIDDKHRAVAANAAKKKMKTGVMKKKPSNPMKDLKRLKGESVKSFSARINDKIKLLKNEASLEDVNRLPEFEETERQNRRRKKRKQSDEPRLSKSQKKTIKLKEKREQQKEIKDLDNLFMVKQDHVKFGEVVHEPPSLKIIPRKAVQADGAPRPARKELLLNKLFDNRQQNTIGTGIMQNYKRETTINSIGVDLKGKRKYLPTPLRNNLEKTQKEAIHAYRNLKLRNSNKPT